MRKRCGWEREHSSSRRSRWGPPRAHHFSRHGRKGRHRHGRLERVAARAAEFLPCVDCNQYAVQDKRLSSTRRAERPRYNVRGRRRACGRISAPPWCREGQRRLPMDAGPSSWADALKEVATRRRAGPRRHSGRSRAMAGTAAGGAGSRDDGRARSREGRTHGRSARLPMRLLCAHLRHPGGQARAPRAARSGWTDLDRTFRTLSALRAGVGRDAGRDGSLLSGLTRGCRASQPER